MPLYIDNWENLVLRPYMAVIWHIVDDVDECNILSIPQRLSGWHPVILRSVPPLTESALLCPYRWQNLPHIWAGAVKWGTSMSSHQCRSYWESTETIYTSLEALATHNQPVKCQMPTAKNVSTRANFRKSDRTCPSLPYIKNLHHLFVL